MDAVEPLSRGIQIGADIGQQVDPSAIVVAERQLRDYRFEERGRPTERPVGGDIHYVIRHIGRLPLRTPYPAVARRLGEIYHQLAPQTADRPPSYEETIRARYYGSLPKRHDTKVRDVLVDSTGVGIPVVELIRAEGVRCTAVTFTGGEKVTSEGNVLHLPKGQMISRLQVLLQQRRIHLPHSAEAEALTEELLNYEIKVTESAHLQLGVFKTGKHDDLATALGLACWDDGNEGTLTIGAAPQVLEDWFGGFSTRDDWRGS